MDLWSRRQQDQPRKRLSIFVYSVRNPLFWRTLDDFPEIKFEDMNEDLEDMSDGDPQINRDIPASTPATVFATTTSSSSSHALYITRKSSNDEPKKPKVSLDESHYRTWKWVLKQYKEPGLINYDYADLNLGLVSNLDFEEADWAEITKHIEDLYLEDRGRYTPISPTLIAQMAASLSPEVKNALIILDLPSGVVVGYDAKSLTLTKDSKIQGLKEVPPGVHFLWAGSGLNSSRSGFWLITPHDGSLEHNNVIVKKWDVRREGLISEEIVPEPSTTKNIIKEAFPKLNSYNSVLGNVSPAASKYPTVWTDLTSYISAPILSRITGISIWNNWHVSTTDEERQSSESISDFSNTNGESELEEGNDARQSFCGEVDEDCSGRLNFVFPKDSQTFSLEATGRERTQQATDTTTHIVSIINGSCEWDADVILGELQFCYITGMVLGNIWCLEHWGHIVKMMFKAIDLTMDQPKFFKKFIEVVQAQLTYDGVGVVGSIFDHDNELADDLRIILTKFKSQVDEKLTKSLDGLTEDQGAFAETFKEFVEVLSKLGPGWDIGSNYLRSGRYQMEDGEYVDAELTELQEEDERGEYAPAVVELDEDGREAGLVRFDDE